MEGRKSGEGTSARSRKKVRGAQPLAAPSPAVARVGDSSGGGGEDGDNGGEGDSGDSGEDDNDDDGEDDGEDDDLDEGGRGAGVGGDGMRDDEDEDAALARALAMSQQDFGGDGGMGSVFGDDQAKLEAQLLACRCLANLMEALPGSAHTVVGYGAVSVLCSKLLDIQSIDLAEQTLSVRPFASSFHTWRLY